MVLPGTLLFPNALLPLYIFEPRYRAMLEHALTKERMFCIASTIPGIDEADGLEDFRSVSAIGLVRACVGREDGTSHLVLQGLSRVRFRGFVQESPFRVAQIQELTSTGSDDSDLEAISAKLLKLCQQIQMADTDERDKLEQQLAQISDPSVLADVIAHTFLRDSEHRQHALETLNVKARLRLIHEHLIAELGG